MMNIKHKNAVGAFPDLQDAESALRQLKATGFSMSNVSVVAQHLNSESDTLVKTTDVTIRSEEEFNVENTVERIEHGAVAAGARGSVVGGVIAGLTTLAFSGSGAVVLVGIAAGAFYGAVSGGILGGGIGFDISEKQAIHYSHLLAQGYYLTIVKGTDDEISQAESILKNKNIQDWLIFNTI
jgi:hypothetical protein